jgi:predicted hydrocarbon binding protein
LNEDSVERLFVASLRSALENTAPERLDVFESWFPPGDRRPRFHIAPVMGAVSYLGRDVEFYNVVMEKAGRIAAAWSYEQLSHVERKFWASMPQSGRERAVKRLLRTGLRNIQRHGELSARREDPKLFLILSNSFFCRAVHGNGPVCLYYASLFSGLMERAGLRWSAVVESSCGESNRTECRFEASS